MPQAVILGSPQSFRTVPDKEVEKKASEAEEMGQERREGVTMMKRRAGLGGVEEGRNQELPE